MCPSYLIITPWNPDLTQKDARLIKTLKNPTSKWKGWKQMGVISKKHPCFMYFSWFASKNHSKLKWSRFFSCVKMFRQIYQFRDHENLPLEPLATLDLSNQGWGNHGAFFSGAFFSGLPTWHELGILCKLSKVLTAVSQNIISCWPRT